MKPLELTRQDCLHAKVEEQRPLELYNFVNYGPTITDQLTIDKLSIRKLSAGIDILRLPDADFDVDSGLLLRNGDLVQWSKYLVSPQIISQAMTDRQKTTLNTTKAVCIGFNRGWKNYYHWMVQCVPAILSYFKVFGRELKIVVPSQLSTVHMETIKRIGISENELLRAVEGSQLHADHIFYSTFLSGANSFLPSALAVESFGLIARKTPQTDPRNLPEIFYIERRDTKHRSVSNEAEVIRVLESLGVPSLSMTGRSLDEQVELFSNARLVIAGHGAGLTNIGFCPNTTILYELMPSHYINRCFAAIAASKQMHYWVDVFPSDELHPQGPHRTSWHIEVEILKDRVSELLSRVRV